MSELSPELIPFAVNHDPRCACVLLLDTSGSMAGASIDQLNQGLRDFERELKDDPLAARRVEVAIITFGNGGVMTVQDFVEASQFTAPTLRAGAVTPMGEAINRALDAVRERKDVYSRAGVQYYRPWIFLVTDGEPTDEWLSVVTRVHEEEGRKGVAFFAVGVDQANMSVLQRIAVRAPLQLQGLAFRDMFTWLSNSMSRVSASAVNDEITLNSPSGWAQV